MVVDENCKLLGETVTIFEAWFQAEPSAERTGLLEKAVAENPSQAPRAVKDWLHGHH